jgi:hypothetical protein
MLKSLSIGVVVLLMTSCATMKNTDTVIEGVYDVSCGICNLEMTGDDCELAIIIDAKKYYVEGSGINEHGDAHAEDGLCSVIRKANVKGVIKKGVFVAEKIELITE